MRVVNRMRHRLVALIVAATVVTGCSRRNCFEPAPKDSARAQIKSLSMSCEAYNMVKGRYPVALEDAAEFMQGEKVPQDPWGHEFLYLSSGMYGTHTSDYGYDISCVAPDGTIIANWNTGRREDSYDDGGTRKDQARVHIAAISLACKKYNTKHGRFPAALTDAKAFMSAGKIPQDPWRHEYRYAVAEPNSRYDFEISCTAPDGTVISFASWKAIRPALGVGRPEARANESAQDAVVHREIKMLSIACYNFNMANGRYPVSLEEARAYASFGRIPLTPWGQAYQYATPGTHPGYRCEIFCTSPDGKILANWDDEPFPPQ